LSDEVKPLVVRPKVARKMLGNCSSAKLYELINAGVLDSYAEGARRLITTESIHRHVRESLAAAARQARDVSASIQARRAKRERS
jgi:hypothetical protein